MRQVFADTSFFVAFLSEDDEHHDEAVEGIRSFDGQIVTTVWVLVELGNYLSKAKTRSRFVSFVRDLRTDRRVLILPADSKAFESALEMYEARSDKEWSVIDCVSFLVMSERRLNQAWTTDHHFEQAGFVALLK